MKYVGIDFRKQTISVCVVTKDKQVLIRKRFFTRETERIRGFFAGLGEFQMVVEATARPPVPARNREFRQMAHKRAATGPVLAG